MRAPQTSFEKWIFNHNPELDWDFDDKALLKFQFISNIKECGDIDLATVYFAFHSAETVID